HPAVWQTGTVKKGKSPAGWATDAVVEDRSLDPKRKLRAPPGDKAPGLSVAQDDSDDGGMEDPEPSPAKPMLMDRATSAPRKQRQPAKFHLVAKIDEYNSDDLVMEHLGRNNLGLSAWEYLAIVPRARKLVRQHLTKHRQYVNREPMAQGVQADETSASESDEEWAEASAHEAPPRSAKTTTRILRLPTMIIPAVIGGARTDVLIDTGSEVNLVPARLAKLLPAGTVQLHPEIPKVFGVGESAVESGKAMWDVMVTTGKISVPTSFLVVNDNHQQTILGMPWLASVDWVVSKSERGQKQLVVTWEGVTERFAIPSGPRTNVVRSLAVTTGIPQTLAARYKPAHKKVHPVAAPMPAEYQTEYPITGRDVFDDVDMNYSGDHRLTDENTRALVI
ncbi:hypothetical protein H4R33_007211, partial [Dimargaris cristalligena]